MKSQQQKKSAAAQNVTDRNYIIGIKRSVNEYLCMHVLIEYLLDLVAKFFNSPFAHINFLITLSMMQ